MVIMDGAMERTHSKRFRAIGPVILIFFVLFVFDLRARDNGEILVSAAISLKDAFKEISSLYEERTGIRVRLNLGASGLLQKQIEAGAPADVFASAGMKQMDALQAGDFIIPGTRRNFARNQLVLILPAMSSYGAVTFEGLSDPNLSRLALGNPKTVPAGQYARQVLKNLKIWERLEPKLVLAENVRQVLEYVVRWEVDAGIVYASDVPASRGRALISAVAPENSHDPILYPIAVVKETGSPEDAEKFIDLVLDDSGQAIMQKYGFLPTR